MNKTTMALLTIPLGLILSLFVCAPLLAQEQGGRNTEIFIPLVQNTRRQVAYASLDAHRDIYLHDVDTGAVTDLTSTPNRNESALLWSPHGNKLLYLSQPTDNGLADLYVVQPDREPVRLATSFRGVGFAWSPDERRLAYWGFARNDQGIFTEALYTMNADGSAQTRIVTPTYSSLLEAPVWAPDSNRLAFACGYAESMEICTVKADGTDLLRLTNDATEDRSPQWAPDGMQIAFTSRRNGNADIYVMKADGAGQRALTHHPADDEGPHWSPDGTMIAFGSDRNQPQDSFAQNLFVMESSGANPWQLTNWPAPDNGQGLSDSFISWLPDGSIAFGVSALYGNGAAGRFVGLYTIHVNGTALTNIASTPTMTSPAWRP